MTMNKLLADSYPGKDKVDQTEAETCNQGIALTGASLSEHGGTIEGLEVSESMFYRNMRSQVLPMMLIPH
jgi:hypothetical protein